MYQNNSNCNQVGFPSEVGEYSLDMEVLGCDQPWLLFYSLSERWPLIIRGEAGGGRLDVRLVIGWGGIFRLLFWPVLLSPNHWRGLNHYPKSLRKGRKIISYSCWAKKAQMQVRKRRIMTLDWYNLEIKM